jgi:uncharacterized protein HemX
MASRPRHKTNGRGGSLSPGTHVSLTITQLILILGAAITLAGGYYWLQSNVVSTTSKVDTFAVKLDKAVQTNADQFKDQDNKRDQLGKDFLASQQQIVAKVSELNTAVTVQQHDTKTIAETLAKISDQLSTVAISPAKH